MVALIDPQDRFIDPNKKTKMRGHDRVFILKPMDDKVPLSELGTVDKRLFSGENKLHAVRDEGSVFLWYFKYDFGSVPSVLKGQRFTKFEHAKAAAEKYYNSRNVVIEEVID